MKLSPHLLRLLAIFLVMGCSKPQPLAATQRVLTSLILVLSDQLNEGLGRARAAAALLDTCLLNSIPYCGNKYVRVDVFELFELDAVACDTRLAELLSIRLSKILLIRDAKEIDGDSCGICTHANLIKVLGASVSILDDLLSVANVWVRNNFALFVFPIQEPQLAVWHLRQNDAMQLLHIAPFWFGLNCNIFFDVLPSVHGGPCRDGGLRGLTTRITRPPD